MLYACLQYYIIMHGIIKMQHYIIKINMRIVLYYKDKYLSYIYYIVHAELYDVTYTITFVLAHHKTTVQLKTNIKSLERYIFHVI